MQIPRYDEWDFEIQQALGWHTTLSVKYVGNHGEHEEITKPALNGFSPTGVKGQETVPGTSNILSSLIEPIENNLPNFTIRFFK